MPINRRNFLKASSLLALPAATVSGAASAGVFGSKKTSSRLATPLHWLSGASPESFRGTTFGLPWPQGQLPKLDENAFFIEGQHPLQSWPLARWPDGSLKWTAHALAPSRDGTSPAASLDLGENRKPGQADSFVIESPELLRIDTGKLRCTIRRSGRAIFDSIDGPAQSRALSAHLVALVDTRDDDSETGSAQRQRYASQVSEASVEQAGPARVVIKLAGAHQREDGRAVLPFTVRLYFYRNSDAVRVLHSFVFDLDEQRESIRGLGLRFDVPLSAPAQERYVRFMGDDGGIFAEAVRGLTGLRRAAGDALAAAQLRGERLPAIPPRIAQGLAHIPAFGDYALLQAHSDAFSIAKRTASPAGWLHAGSGARAAGSGYLGTPEGGVAFGIRNFWQSYPGQLDIRGAAGDSAQVTLWLWAPDAPGMDLRFYHDGLGQTDYPGQIQGLDITYEDYEPGFGRPYGVARTSELELQLLPATPSASALLEISRRIQTPPQLITTPGRYQQGQAFSELWAPASAEVKAEPIERRLGWLFDFYRKEVEQRRWYGFWDYGDVMHTYDNDRHVWRYDVGGYAWDNSELSTEIWLWHYFLHSGRGDVFRMAEAMTRHVGEVDVHHAGPFSPLGSRHNVRHWGDSAKQLRISSAINRRFLYYLTADERTGDLLHEQADAVNRLQQIVPGRKVGQQAAQGEGVEHLAAVAFGTDWGAIAAAWLTEWERTGNTLYRDRLLGSMASIAAQPHGFFTGSGIMDLRTGAFRIEKNDAISVSHLSAAFGLAEICSEIIRSIPDTAFRKAWLDYCVLYNASTQVQIQVLGKSLGALNLGQGHARLLGYAGRELKDADLRRQAWKQFFEGRAGLLEHDFASRRIDVPLVLNAVEEAPGLSTNAVAQWGLAAMGMLAIAPAELA
jgi:hypothetical protein